LQANDSFLDWNCYKLVVGRLVFNMDNMWLA